MFTIQVFFQLGEAVIEWCNIFLEFMLECLSCIRCAAGCFADTKINTAVGQMIDQLELFSDMKWIMMGQHDAACSDMHFVCVCSKVGNEHFRCRTNQCFQVVVF